MASDMKHLRGKAACVGAATWGTGEAPGWNSLEIMGQAACAALTDAGLTVGDVDGVWAATAVHAMPGMSLAEHLGIVPKFSSGSNIGGSSFMSHALDAAILLDAGLIDVALIAYGSNQRTAGGFRSASEPMPFEAQYDIRNPINAYAMAAARYMHEFGASREHLADVAVSARAWASHNPEAFARDPISREDVLQARMISDPLSKLDCCLVTDGGGAIVMVRADAAKEHRDPVYLLGAAMAHDHRMISEMPTLTTTCAVDAGRRAFSMAGLGPDDMDTVQLYDAFTINTILFLEDLGFCRKGEGKDFVGGGHIAPGGGLPVNTSGGGLSCVHPGMYGLFVMIEAIRQCRGVAPGVQIPDVNVSLAHGNGGVLSSQVTTIWGTAATL
ncbi:MAG: acetyl-CoA acetyltransferase [Pseudomonadota bacterium]